MTPAQYTTLRTRVMALPDRDLGALLHHLIVASPEAVLAALALVTCGAGRCTCGDHIDAEGIAHHPPELVMTGAGPAPVGAL